MDLNDWIKKTNMTLRSFAKQVDVSSVTLYKVCFTDAPIRASIIKKIESITGGEVDLKHRIFRSPLKRGPGRPKRGTEPTWRKKHLTELGESEQTATAKDCRDAEVRLSVFEEGIQDIFRWSALNPTDSPLTHADTKMLGRLKLASARAREYNQSLNSALMQEARQKQ